MGRLLFIVSSDRPDLYNYLTWKYSGEQEVEIILDRRRTERRQFVQPYESERRYGDRRNRAARDDQFALGHVITRQLAMENRGSLPPAKVFRTGLSRAEIRIGEKFGSLTSGR